MTTPVLLTARCAAGHEWDLWAEREGDSNPTVDQSKLYCPECDAFAERVVEPESLA